jgi:pimeloyl-ACP methyl ester carboxylesterase
VVDSIELPAGGLTFTGRAAGPPDGRLVLLLHGFPQSSYEWRHQLDALAGAGYRAVAFDQRGYSPGARPEGVEHYRVDRLVADVLAVADELGAHQLDLVGHDWGAVVAWQVAGRYPARLRTLTSVSVPHPAALRDAIEAGGDQRRRSAYIAAFRMESSEKVLLADDARALRAMFTASGLKDPPEEYVTLMRQPGAMRAALDWYRAASLEDVDAMGPVTTPTLYVWSDNDVALGREAAEATAHHVSGPYRFEVLEGVSHWIPEEAPDQLNRLLLEHVSAWD